MERITVEISDALAQELKRYSRDLNELLLLGLRQDARIQFALREYQAGRASIGHAAYLAGLTVQEIVEQAVKHGVKPHWDWDMIRQELAE